MNLIFYFIFPERIKYFSYQDTFKASYCSRHFYFSPVRHFSIARHKYKRLRHLFFFISVIIEIQVNFIWHFKNGNS